MRPVWNWILDIVLTFLLGAIVGLCLLLILFVAALIVAIIVTCPPTIGCILAVFVFGLFLRKHFDL